MIKDMREFPILFSTPMVQAIISGRKTQTRRIVKYPRLRWQLGMKLWVRETWGLQRNDWPEEADCPFFCYKADDETYLPKWKSSIFMPKEACRIRLEITDIRVERLQDISEEDAIAEGVGYGFQMNAGWPDYEHIKNGVCTLTQDTAKMSFASLWDSINGKKHPWESNLWVDVIEFQLNNLV